MAGDTQIILYFGGLALVTLLGLAFLFVMFLRGRSTPDIHQPRQPRGGEPVGRQHPMVQVVLPDEGGSLVWLIEGQLYTDPSLAASPEEHNALRLFREQMLAALGGIQQTAPRAPSHSGPGLQRTLLPPGPIAQRQARAIAEEPDEPAGPQPPVRKVPQVPPPPVAPRSAPASRSLTYEEALQRPLFERLRDSFLGDRGNNGVTERLDQMSYSAIPRLDSLDDFLQAELAELPREIHASIRIGVNGLLEIIVDGTVFERIEEIQQADVRGAMRRAVQQWERRLG